MEGARGVLLTIAGPSEMTLHEVNEAAMVVAEHSDVEADIIFGAVVDDNLGEEIKVTVIAAGFDRSRRTDTRGIASGSVTRATEAADGLDIPSFVQG